MTTIIRCAVGVLALLMFAGLLPAQGPSKGKVLLLENERILEGDIERIEDQYRVRRTVGETLVPASKVLCLCQKPEEAYAYLRDRANLRDPDERLRLAHWCYLNNLREQALAEVAAATELRPDHPPTQRLLDNLKRATSYPPAAKPALPVEHPEPPPIPPIDVTQESLGQFVTHVQPILLNACASCHASGRGGNFKLSRPPNNDLAGKRTLQQNLAMTLAQIHLDQPQSSPLLTKSVSVHGEMKDPPLRGPQLAAYRTLEEWVKLTVANAPQPRPTAVATSHPPTAPIRSETPPKPAEEKPVALPPEKPPQPQASTNDPYDPGPFNQQVRPERK